MKYCALLLLGLTACASPPAVLPEVSPEVAAKLWSFDTARGALAKASCPAGARDIPFEQIKITADPVDLGGKLDGLSYVGGWHLTSSNPSFGGLSGLEWTDTGDLLSVSDSGAFVQIQIADDKPNGSGALAYMRHANGRQLSGKTDADAEGLAYRDGLALVSFEREHRILAFDLGGCQSNARGVELAKLPSEQAGKRFGENRGAEALSLSAGGEITYGYEAGPGGGAPLGTVYGDGRARLTADASVPRGFAQVGRDELGGVTAELFRSYDPIRGNRNVVRIGDLQARLARPMTVDNFEGIALQKKPDGGLRIWIVSDDNFNPKQRTLLMAFDLSAE